jgi:hypothetical protein
MSAQAQEGARLGPIERFTGVLFSPGETYQDINRKPTWIVPTIIGIIIAIASTIFFTWRVNPDWNRFVREQVRQRVDKVGGQMPSEEQIQQQVRITQTFAKFGPAIAAIVVPLFYLILAGIFALGLMLLQAKTTFKRILSVVAWTWAPIGLVSNIVFAASLMLQDRQALDNINPQNPTANIPTNLGPLLPSDAAAPLQAIASSLDVFTIWALVLLSIGFAAISGSRKITAKKTAVLVFGLWAVWVVIKIGFAVILGG